ncbi:MAG TPA: alpha/beta fold hydrolase [Candidatus Binataceae bacterium]|nr:alpha/beta fold hydrolase [Candidatus Binataceae bacterium]
MRKSITIWSEGARLAGDLWTPDEAAAGDKLPAILLCHGWGGLKQHLNMTYAPLFSKAGFVVLAFDYRGWGESDPRLVPAGEIGAPDSDGVVTVRARALRQVVDPFDQIRDITNCIDFLEGEPQVNADRIGLWGTSYGGGHVSFMAAHDPRVTAIVAQASAQRGGLPSLTAMGQARAVARARGEIGPIPPAEDAVPGLGGTPDLSKMVRFCPIATAAEIRVPTLVIDAAEEELFDRMQNGYALHQIVSKNAPAKYVAFPCKHYAIYDQYYPDASALAKDWFITHLKNA